MKLQLAIFLLAFIALTGAWMGFWAVRSFVLTEDGSIDISTSHFVAWSIRVLAVVLILQVPLYRSFKVFMYDERSIFCPYMHLQYECFLQILLWPYFRVLWIP